MKHTNGEGVLFLALLTAAVACADPVGRTVGVDGTSNVKGQPASFSPSEERAGLSKVARLVASALDNEPARQHLKGDMRKAPFREHKLELGPYLRSKDGKALLDRMVALNGGTDADLFRTVSAIRRLEFYMPVAGHREKWTGSADVLVVSQLEESEPIVAFDESGQEVALDRNVAPPQPTLAIIPVETRFDQPMPAATSRNARDAAGAAIGTLEAVKPRTSSLVACDDSCDGGGGGGISAPVIAPGLYLEFSRILDMKEPWFRGDPEVEVHIQGPTDLGNPRYGADLSCSGEHAYYPEKVFDQNDGFWTGRVLLFGGTEAINFASKFHDGFNIMFWEDDNGECTLKTDINQLKASLEASGRGGVALATQLLKGVSWYITAGIFVLSAVQSSDWLLTNDDFLGIAVWQSNLGYAYENTTHVIMDGGTLNGRAQIYWH
jgi:hypothetical protein